MSKFEDITINCFSCPLPDGIITVKWVDGERVESVISHEEAELEMLGKLKSFEVWEPLPEYKEGDKVVITDKEHPERNGTYIGRKTPGGFLLFERINDNFGE